MSLLPSKRVLAVLLVVVGGLLVVTLYKMETLTDYFHQQLHRQNSYHSKPEKGDAKPGKVVCMIHSVLGFSLLFHFTAAA